MRYAVEEEVAYGNFKSRAFNETVRTGGGAGAVSYTHLDVYKRQASMHVKIQVKQYLKVRKPYELGTMDRVL